MNNTGTGKCDPGYYCKVGNSIARPTNATLIAGAVGGVCPIGHYCPEQTEVMCEHTNKIGAAVSFYFFEAILVTSVACIFFGEIPF